MEDIHSHHHPLLMAAYALVSIVSGLIASIAANVELWVRIGAGGAAIVSAAFAVRHYYYATKKIQQELKQLNQ